jgi:hypothetical protein
VKNRKEKMLHNFVFSNFASETTAATLLWTYVAVVLKVFAVCLFAIVFIDKRILFGINKVKCSMNEKH